MSTRGAYGFRVNEQDKVTYNHSDSYLESLGVSVLSFVANESTESMKKTAERIKLVKEDKKPTEAQIKKCESYTNLGVSKRSVDDWYCLMRNAQGELDIYAGDDGFPYMIDSHDFLFDSLSCEWAYIINLDDGVLEIYKGFNSDPNADGRYASAKGEGAMPRTDTYYGVALIRTLSFDEIRKIDNVAQYCEQLQEEIYAAE